MLPNNKYVAQEWSKPFWDTAKSVIFHKKIGKIIAMLNIAMQYNVNTNIKIVLDLKFI